MWGAQVYANSGCNGVATTSFFGNGNMSCSTFAVLGNTMYGRVNCAAPQYCDLVPSLMSSSSSTGMSSTGTAINDTGKDCANRTAFFCTEANCGGTCGSIRGPSGTCIGFVNPNGGQQLWAKANCNGSLSSSSWSVGLFLDSSCSSALTSPLTGQGSGTCYFKDLGAAHFSLTLDCGLASYCSAAFSSSGGSTGRSSSSTGNLGSAAPHSAATDLAVIVLATMLAVVAQLAKQ